MTTQRVVDADSLAQLAAEIGADEVTVTYDRDADEIRIEHPDGIDMVDCYERGIGLVRMWAAAE